MRALIVDDSQATRMILRRLLSRFGFEVLEAADGQEGLGRLHEMEDPGLILVDWNMPVMNGFDFVRAVRAESRFDAVPVVMVTANNELASVAEALAAGANEYIMKPFDREIVREKLELLGVRAAS